MAEAHEAVAFQFTVGSEGIDLKHFLFISTYIIYLIGVSVNLSYDVFKALIYSGLRSWKLRCRRTLNSLHNTLYPGHPVRGIAWCGIIYTCYIKDHDPSYHIIDWIDSHIFRRYFAPRHSKVLACIAFGAGTYLVLIQIRQYSLKMLFSYHGWMYHEHGKSMGLGQKLWGGLVKLLIGRNPSLYSYQSVLPTLPLPSLDDTLKKYLRSVRPLYDDAEYHQMEILAEEFKQTIGRKLQRYLWLKWLISTNYVTKILFKRTFDFLFGFEL
jgi:carnitine O-palmitoyltransferase 1